MKISFSPSCNVQSPQVPSTLFWDPLFDSSRSFVYITLQRSFVVPKSVELVVAGLNVLPADTTTSNELAWTITLPLPSFNAVASIPVRFAPLPLNDVAVTTPVTSIPWEFAVTAEPTTILLKVVDY